MPTNKELLNHFSKFLVSLSSQISEINKSNTKALKKRGIHQVSNGDVTETYDHVLASELFKGLISQINNEKVIMKQLGKKKTTRKPKGETLVLVSRDFYELISFLAQEYSNTTLPKNVYELDDGTKMYILSKNTIFYIYYCTIAKINGNNKLYHLEDDIAEKLRTLHTGYKCDGETMLNFLLNKKLKAKKGEDESTVKTAAIMNGKKVSITVFSMQSLLYQCNYSTKANELDEALKTDDKYKDKYDDIIEQLQASQREANIEKERVKEYKDGHNKVYQRGTTPKKRAPLRTGSRSPVKR